MSSADTPQGFSGEREATVPPEARTLSDQRHAIGKSSKKTLRELRAYLDHALSKYYLGEYGEISNKTLREVVSDLGEMRTDHAITSDSDQISPSLLYAAACALLGQLHDRLGYHSEAQRAFHESVVAFDEIHEAGGRFLEQYYGEYGIALHMVGRQNDAIEYLERAIPTPETYRHLGLILKEEGRYDGAVDKFRKALKLVPDDPLTHKALGETREDQGQAEEAAAAYEKAALDLASAHRPDQSLTMLNRALSLRPDDHTALINKGLLLIALRRYEEALETLEMGSVRAPVDIQGYALAYKGHALRQLGRTDEAVTVLQSAVNLDPRIAWAHAELGETLRAQGSYGQARQALEQALELEPDNSVALGTKGAVLYELGSYPEALKALNRALELSPDYSVALGTKGAVLYELGRYPEALKALEQALDLDPDYSMALCVKGEVLRKLGRNQKALRALNRALALDPDYARALASRGETLRALGRHEEARQALERALELEPDYVFALGTKGAVLYELGRYPKALKTLNRALELSPDYSFAMLIKGRLLCDAAYYEPALLLLEKAELLLREAEQGNATRSWILAQRGWALEKIGSRRAQEALQAYDVALRLSPANPYLHKARANALYLLDDVEGATTEYEAAIDRASKRTDEWSMTYLALLGWCYCRLGRYDEALDLYIHALALNPITVSTPTMVSVQFDFALTLMCKKEYARALSEYREALKRSQDIHVLRRRGLLHVALQDLRIATDKQHLPGAEVQQGLAQLHRAFKRTRKLTNQPQE